MLFLSAVILKSPATDFDNTRPVCYELSMTIECDGKVIEYNKPIDIYRLMEQPSINREVYLPMVNDRLVTEDYRAEKGDSVKFIKVVSGG